MMISSEGSSPVSTSPKAEQSNLLEQILRECCDADEMNSASLPDSTLFVLGRNCQGKTILLNELAGSSHSNEMKRDYVLEYGSMKLQQEEKHTGIYIYVYHMIQQYSLQSHLSFLVHVF